MGAVSYVGEPIVPSLLDTASTSLPLTTTTSRSRLKSIFHRRKVSTGSLSSFAQNGDDNSAGSVRSLHKSKSRPSLGHRSPTDYPAKERSRSTERRPVSRREKAIYDPPPLAQVHSQAILHASLEAPISFHGKSPRSTPTKDASPTDLQESVEVKRSHRKTESGVSTCSVKDKTFFLTSGPYIMQYDGDGGGDALPEKIMILDRSSVVFASDAVPGRHWVLQVSKRKSNHGSPHSSRAGWPRLTFRSLEERRIADTLLLIFNDSEDMCTWLFAIRKEIENLGGEESRPVTRDEDRAWKDLASSFAPPDAEISSLHSTSMRLRSPITSPVVSVSLSSRSMRAIGCSASVRSSTSSKKTRTSLDRFRDSMASDGYSSTIATSCADSSIASTSPTRYKFPNITSVADNANAEHAMRSHNTSRYGKLVAHPKTILERKELSVESLQLTKSDNSRIAVTDVASFSMSPRNLSPEPESCKQSQEEDKSKEPSPRKKVESRAYSRAEHDVSRPPSRKPSLHEPAAATAKPKYSLFPSCRPIELKPEPLADPSTVEPLSHVAKTNLGKIIIKQHLGVQPKHQKTRSRTLTLNARDVRMSTFLSPGGIDAPQRSPAATSEMISFNFGASAIDIPPSPVQKIPGFNNMKFDLDFLKEPYQQTSRKTSQTERRKMLGAKSMTNLHNEASTMARPPVGPPPAGPLPAVPSDSRRSSQTTNRSSQWSQSSQGSQYSRKSDVESKRTSNEMKDTTSQSRSMITVFPSSERQEKHKWTTSQTQNLANSEKLGVQVYSSRSRSQDPPRLSNYQT